MDAHRSPARDAPAARAGGALRAGDRLCVAAAVRAVARAGAGHAVLPLRAVAARWFRYDILLNVVAYVPFGFFVGLLRAARRPRGASRSASSSASRCRSRWKRCRCTCRRATRARSTCCANTAGALIGGVLATGARAATASTRRALYRHARAAVPAGTSRRRRPRAARAVARRADESGHSAVRRDVRQRYRDGGRLVAARRRRRGHRAACSSGRRQRRSRCSASDCSSRCCCASGAAPAASCCADRRRAAAEGHRGHR